MILKTTDIAPSGLFKGRVMVLEVMSLSELSIDQIVSKESPLSKETSIEASAGLEGDLQVTSKIMYTESSGAGIIIGAVVISALIA